MSMSKRAPVKSEIEKAFDTFMEYPHLGVPTDAGFDSETYRALAAVAADPENERLRSRARLELKKQFDGKHNEDDEKSWEAALRGTRG